MEPELSASKIEKVSTTRGSDISWMTLVTVRVRARVRVRVGHQLDDAVRVRVRVG